MPIFDIPPSDDLQSIFDWVYEHRQPTTLGRYLRDMTVLEWLWQQTIPGLQFTVLDDDPGNIPDRSTGTAMTAFASLQRNSVALEWFTQHIRNVVVHTAASDDALAFEQDSIHFYQSKSVSPHLGERIYDQLHPSQREHFAELHSWTDPRQAFVTLVNSMIASPTDVARIPGFHEQLLRFRKIGRLSIQVTPATRLEKLDCVEQPTDSEWTNQKNDRRIELIDKDIQGSLSPEERAELADLQRQAITYRDRVAPLPTQGAKRLHHELLKKKRDQNGP